MKNEKLVNYLALSRIYYSLTEKHTNTQSEVDVLNNIIINLRCDLLKDVPIIDKSVLITGNRSTGKTELAKHLAIQFSLKNVVYLSYNAFNFASSFNFSNCNKNTELVIIDDIPNIVNTQDFFNYLSNGIIVNKKMHPAFTIKPKFILVCNCETPTISKSIHNRLNVISL